MCVVGIQKIIYAVCLSVDVISSNLASVNEAEALLFRANVHVLVHVLYMPNAVTFIRQHNE